jgi:hypothetical protein
LKQTFLFFLTAILAAYFTVWLLFTMVTWMNSRRTLVQVIADQARWLWELLHRVW